MSGGKRPLGITIISLLLWVVSVLYSLLAIFLYTDRWKAALIGLVFASISEALWRLRDWVRVVLILLFVLTATSNLATLLAYSLPQHNYRLTVTLLLPFSVSTVLIYYLNRRNVLQAFGSLITWPTLVVKRPLGITIISILLWIASIAHLLLAAFWHTGRWTADIWTAATRILIGSVFAGIGVGLWKRRNWARVVLIFLLVLTAAVSLAALLNNVLVQHDYKFASVLFLLFSISVFFIHYLNRRSVQQAFASLSAWPTTIKALVLAVFTVLLAFPFYWMVIATFKQNLDLYTVENNPFIFNAKPTLDNLRLLFETRFVHWLGNTALVGLVVVAITLFLAVPAAYALARLTGRWGQRLGIAIFLTYLVPPTLLFIPLARVVARLGLQDSIWALVLIYPSFTVPFSIWLLMGFFKSIPKELEDAAMVDGLTRFGAFVKMVIPISISGILTVVIFTFTLVTQEFVYALTFISSESKQMVGVGIPIFLVRGDVYFWGSLMAACLIASLPIAFLYNLFLDRFIAGFTVGAVKG